MRKGIQQSSDVVSPIEEGGKRSTRLKKTDDPKECATLPEEVVVDHSHCREYVVAEERDRGATE